MKTLIDDIRKTSGISQTQAELALGTVLEFFSAQLPSPIMGRIRESLRNRIGQPEPAQKSEELGNA